MSEKLKLVARSQKVAYMDVGTESVPDFQRMKGFTSLPIAKNPKEYNRQYVDEPFERADLVGHNVQRDFAFDQIKDNAVHALLVDIIDGEKVLEDAQVTILQVDISGGTSPYPATQRLFTVIPGTEGDNLDAYTYGGSFKSAGAAIEGTVVLSLNDTKAVFTPATPQEG